MSQTEFPFTPYVNGALLLTAGSGTSTSTALPGFSTAAPSTCRVANLHNGYIIVNFGPSTVQASGTNGAAIPPNESDVFGISDATPFIAVISGSGTATGLIQVCVGMGV